MRAYDGRRALLDDILGEDFALVGYADRLTVDGIPPFFVSQKSVVKVRTTAMDIATAIFGCLLSKWHLVTRLLLVWTGAPGDRQEA